MFDIDLKDVGGVLCCAASDIEIEGFIFRDAFLRLQLLQQSMLHLQDGSHQRTTEGSHRRRVDPGVERKKSPLTLGTLRRSEHQGSALSPIAPQLEPIENTELLKVPTQAIQRRVFSP